MCKNKPTETPTYNPMGPKVPDSTGHPRRSYVHSPTDHRSWNKTRGTCILLLWWLYQVAFGAAHCGTPAGNTLLLFTKGYNKLCRRSSRTQLVWFALIHPGLLLTQQQTIPQTVRVVVPTPPKGSATYPGWHSNLQTTFCFAECYACKLHEPHRIANVEGEMGFSVEGRIGFTNPVEASRRLCVLML